jgi:multidrug resistance efflux pump
MSPIRNRRKMMLAIASLAATCVIGSVYTLSLATVTASPASGHQPGVVPVPIQGKISQLLVRDGDTVQAGQVIAKLDPSEYEAEIAEAQAEIQMIQSQAQGSIMPMQPLPGMSGTLPGRVPEPEYIRVPVKAPAKPVPMLPTTKPKPQAETKPVDAYHAASKQRQDVQADHDKAVKTLAEATASLGEAQAARDALRPKITVAEAEAVQAERRAAGVPALLEAGAISLKRSQELNDEKAATAKALEDVKAKIAEADKALIEAQAAQDAAKTSLDRTTAALQAVDAMLAKSSTESPKVEVPAKADIAKTEVAPTKPAKTEFKLVTRKMPLVVRQEEPPAIPLQVFVDEKAMKNSQGRIQELQLKIAGLKKRMSQCDLTAPVAGIVRISGVSTLTISITRQ